MQTAVVLMQQLSHEPPSAAVRTMAPEELADLLASSYSYDPELVRRPLLAVLDTSFVRTALHHEPTKGTDAARSRWREMARSGSSWSTRR